MDEIYNFRQTEFRVRVEASITDHLRDFVIDLEKYKVVQIFFYVGR